MTDFKSEMRDVLEEYEYDLTNFTDEGEVGHVIRYKYDGEIDNIWDKVEASLLALIEKRIESLYGGGKNCPQCNEDNEEAIIGIWDSCLSEIKKEMGI